MNSKSCTFRLRFGEIGGLAVDVAPRMHSIKGVVVHAICSMGGSRNMGGAKLVWCFLMFVC